jgi:hypothetical protein
MPVVYSDPGQVRGRNQEVPHYPPPWYWRPEGHLFVPPGRDGGGMAPVG